MSFRRNILGFILSVILVCVLLIPFLAVGRAFRVSFLPDKGENFGCGTCHVNPGGGGPRNAFGRDWEAIAIPNGDRYVAELANKDSDGDGFTNDEEFKAGKHPGDPLSKPDKPRAVSARGKLATLWSKIRSTVLR